MIGFWKAEFSRKAIEDEEENEDEDDGVLSTISLLHYSMIPLRRASQASHLTQALIENIDSLIEFFAADGQGGVRVKMFPIVTLKLSPQRRAAYITRSASSVARSSVLASRSNSNPISKPSPRTSPTIRLR